MSTTNLQGNPISLYAELPALNSKAYNFKLIGNDLSEVSLNDFIGKKVILNIFPSLDTDVCAASVRRFNAEASNLENTVVLCISRDLPFAQARFCGAEGLKNVITLSDMTNSDFGEKYGIKMLEGPLASLFARSIVIIDEEGKVKYTELVPEITQEPNYEKALANIA